MHLTTTKLSFLIGIIFETISEGAKISTWESFYNYRADFFFCPTKVKEAAVAERKENLLVDNILQNVKQRRSCSSRCRRRAKSSARTPFLSDEVEKGSWVGLPVSTFTGRVHRLSYIDTTMAGWFLLSSTYQQPWKVAWGHSLIC